MYLKKAKQCMDNYMDLNYRTVDHSNQAQLQINYCFLETSWLPTESRGDILTCDLCLEEIYSGLSDSLEKQDCDLHA